MGTDHTEILTELAKDIGEIKAYTKTMNTRLTNVETFITEETKEIKDRVGVVEQKYSKIKYITTGIAICAVIVAEGVHKGLIKLSSFF